MAKRIFIPLIILGILAGTFWIFLQFKKNNEQAPDAINFVPKNATTILHLHTEDWNTFYAQSSALSLLLDAKYQPLKTFLQDIDSLRSQREGIQEVLNNKGKYLSFFEKNPQGKDWLFSTGLLSYQNDEYFRNLFDEIEFKEKHLGKNIIHLHRKLNWAIVNQVLLASPNEQLIQENISSIVAKENIMQDSLFAQAFRAQGERNIHIITKKKSDIPFDLENQHQARWIAYETKITNGVLDFFGLEITDKGKKATNFEFTLPLSLLPKDNLVFENVQIGDIEAFLSETKQKLTEEKKINEFTNTINSIENNCQCEPEAIAFNRTKSFGKFSSGKRHFVYLNYANFTEALPEYQPLINENNAGEKNGFSIYELKYTNLYATLLNQAALNQIKYFTYNNNELIFSPKIEDIHWLIQQWKDGNTCDNDTKLTRFIPHLETNSDWFYYAQNSHQREIIYPFATNNEPLVWQKEHLAQGTYNHIEIPTTVAQRLPLNITKTTNSQNETTPISDNTSASFPSYNLQAMATSKPTIVTNHYTKEKEIFVQDEKNNIYLINNKGKELWHKKVEGKIQSPVRQIDVYRNGKLQLVFNTENKIYCLDRNGKNVDGFPVKLKSKASSPLAVFDYDKKRKYRLVIGCEDKKIYNYTVEGKNTFGWKYQASDSPAIAIEHLRIKGKDYILALLANNRISILKRTGTTKYHASARAVDYNHQGYALDIASKIEKTRMLYINSQGELIALSFGQIDGEVLKTGLDKNAKLTYADVDGDKKSDLLVSSQNALKVYSSNLKEIFSKTYSTEIRFAPNAYRLNSKDIRIGINTQDDKFHLLDNQGNESSGFPKSATQPLEIEDLNKDGEKEVVVLNKNHVLIEE